VITTSPSVAVVIPTRNRHAAIQRTLRAFAAQSPFPGAMEIIVVADGCTDRTRDIADANWAVPVRVIEQPHQGPAAARNRGASETSAEIVIFLDDDIEVWPGFIDGHLRAHAEGDPARVVIGYLPADVQGRRDFFGVTLRGWWDAMFERMREPGHRFSYKDLLSGNFSIRRSLFREVGGFNERLLCHEDYELGYRLIRSGARLTFAEAAAGWHHEHTDLLRALSRKRDEGRADVALAALHPALTPALPLCRVARLPRRHRILRTLALTQPAAGDLVAAAYRSLLVPLEAARVRTRWRRVLETLLVYWYWRGVGESISAHPSTNASQFNCVAEAPVYTLDLSSGLAVAIRTLDQERPEALRLCWGAHDIATVPPDPGTEPLRGEHLPLLLRSRYAGRFANALAAAHGALADTAAPSAASHLPETGPDISSMRGA
jgi:GT2 family glycosyltransferase